MAMELKCPNCGTAAAGAKAGTRIVCVTCGGTFEYIADEAKLKDIGVIDQLQADMEELKKRMPVSTPGAEPPRDESDDRDDLGDEQDEDDL